MSRNLEVIGHPDHTPPRFQFAADVRESVRACSPAQRTAPRASHFLEGFFAGRSPSLHSLHAAIAEQAERGASADALRAVGHTVDRHIGALIVSYGVREGTAPVQSLTDATLEEIGTEGEVALLQAAALSDPSNIGKTRALVDGIRREISKSVGQLRSAEHHLERLLAGRAVGLSR